MKIAHISDFHLRHHLSGGDVQDMPDLISEAARQIAAHTPDLVAVTGDLVDYPLDALRDPTTVARGERDLHLVRECFACLTCPIAYLYGNHDHPASFRRVFCDQPLDFDVRGFRAIIFLDDLEGHDAVKIPQRVGAEHARFQSVLSDSDPRPQIHLQHYLIFPERNADYPFSYGNAAELKAALLADSRPKLVLSGHYHKGEPLRSEDHVYFATARAFRDPPHPYRIYTVTDMHVTQAEHTL